MANDNSGPDNDVPERLKAFVDDSSAGRLLYIHMVVLRNLLGQMRQRGSLTHAEAMRLLLDTIHDCAPDGALRSEDEAARDILWATIVEQIGPAGSGSDTDT